MEIIKATKLSNSSIEITKQDATPVPVTPPETKVVYEFDFLKNQRATIIAQSNSWVEQKNKEIAAYLAARQLEIEEVDILLAKCEELGISAKVLAEPIEIAPL